MRVFSGHADNINIPNVGINKVNERMYILMPAPEPFDVEFLKKIYELQEKILIMA